VRRKRKGLEMRNRLRVGGVILALAGLNAYVFFFNKRTALKDVLEPTMSRAALANDKAAPIAGGAVGGRPAGGAGSAGVGNAARQVEGKIGGKDTLGTVLAREGFGPEAGAVIKAMEKIVDLRRMRPGEAYTVHFDESGTPVGFEYRPTAVLRIEVSRDAEGVWKARKIEHPTETRLEKATGQVESSVYESVQSAGESAALVALLVDLFAWDINFYIDTHPGDRWKVVVEKQYLDGKFYKYGRLLAAEYSGRVGTFRAFFYPTRDGEGRYYDDKGQAVAKTFLKSPLRFVRVSSKFNPKRFHPILHRVKAHLGVDYAAPTGTPIWAAAGGRVTEVGKKSGSGNTVVIRHPNGLSTRYYHLSRFAPGLKAGQQVKQKQVIGFVGATGLATGPHLHFSVTKGGAFVDPTKVASSREPGVRDRAGYLAAIAPRLEELARLEAQPTEAVATAASPGTDPVLGAP